MPPKSKKNHVCTETWKINTALSDISPGTVHWRSVWKSLKKSKYGGHAHAGTYKEWPLLCKRPVPLWRVGWFYDGVLTQWQFPSVWLADSSDRVEPAFFSSPPPRFHFGLKRQLHPFRIPTRIDDVLDEGRGLVLYDYKLYLR